MIAIVSAVREEIAEYLSRGRFRTAVEDRGVRLYRSSALRHVAVAEGGMGREYAEKATRQVIERLDPDLIISAGFAGAVRSGLQTADLVSCQTLWSVDGPQDSWSPATACSRSPAYQTAAAWRGRASNGPEKVPIRGDCLTVPRVVSDPSAKQEIGQRFPVSVIDMESFWVSQTAAAFGVPCVALKAVLDPVEQRLPPHIVSTTAYGGAGRRRRAILYALSRPWEITGLIDLGSRARAASASLATALMDIASNPEAFSAGRTAAG